MAPCETHAAVRSRLKRLSDLLMAGTGMLVTVPVLLLATLVVRITMGRPCLFRQKRPGLHGRLFELYKLRTMNEKRDAQGKLLPDEERLTWIGRVIRKTSIDELPQLWNVLKGDMSIVGPRPLLPEYLPLYTPRQMRRHEVKPGITGWAQVNGRNELSWEEKFERDLSYVENWTLWMDVRIIALTAWKIVTGAGISQPGRATVDRFLPKAPEPNGPDGRTEDWENHTVSGGRQ